VSLSFSYIGKILWIQASSLIDHEDIFIMSSNSGFSDNSGKRLQDFRFVVWNMMQEPGDQGEVAEGILKHASVGI
jgi:hypothetical protein